MNAPAADMLAGLSRAILDEGRDIGTLVSETEQLRQLVESCSGLGMLQDCDINAGKTVTPNGLAVSAMQAAFCAREPLRTAAFIKGLYLAVQTALQSRSQVSVLYAGCGPYALLALPVMAHYSPEQVQFSLLEIHPQTLANAVGLIHALGLQAYVSDYHQADASQYRIPEAAMPDIILSETMNIALGKEPQVAIMRNLYRQAPQALLVPQAVHVHLGSRKTALTPDALPAYDDFGCVFTLDAEHMQSWQNDESQKLPAYRIELPRTTRQALYLLTRIQTFGKWQLHDHESSLNLPQKLTLPSERNAASQLDFYYRLGSCPGLFLK